MLNAEDPVVAGVRGARDGAGRPLPARPPAARRARRGRRLDRRGRRASACRWPAAGSAATGPGRPDHAGRRAGDPRRRTTSPTRWPRSPSALLFGVAPDAIRRGRGGVHRRRAPARAGRASIDGVRFVNDSQGTQPDAVIAALRAFEPPDRADRRRPRQGRRPVARSRRSSRRARRRRGADRRERPGRSRRCSATPAWPATERAGDLDEAVATRGRDRPRGARRRPRGRRPATVLLSPAAASFDMFEDYAARGRAFKAGGRPTWPQHAPQEERPMNLAPPIPRLDRPPPRGRAEPGRRADRGDADGEEPRQRAPARAPRARLRDPRRGRRPGRDRHPDGLLVVGDARLPVAATTTRSRSSGRRSSGRSSGSSRWSR